MSLNRVRGQVPPASLRRQRLRLKVARQIPLTPIHEYVQYLREGDGNVGAVRAIPFGLKIA